MHCKDCGFANGQDDHRCLRCGRRIAGAVIAAPLGYSGANALALAPDLEPRAEQMRVQETRQTVPSQPALFAGGRPNVIPFDEIRRRFLGRDVAEPVPVEVSVPAARPASKRHVTAPSPDQGLLDFVPATAAPRTLKTAVPAQIFCPQTVATPQHRLVACAIDTAMILLAFGVFGGIVQATGSGLGTGKTFWIVLSMSFGLISGFYGLIWAIAGRETAGMDMADLQLITFDGFPVDGRSRMIRFASTWLSFCSGGLGIIWAVADEENLTWHDHISKTFPTFRDVPRNFVKQRSR